MIVEIPEGYHVEIEEEIFTYNIIVTDGVLSVEHRWTYETSDQAVEACIEWEQRGYHGEEPNGWIRHQPSNRRRKYDPFFEYVAP